MNHKNRMQLASQFTAIAFCILVTAKADGIPPSSSNSKAAITTTPNTTHRPHSKLSAIPPGTAQDLGQYRCVERIIDGEKIVCWTITDYSRFNYDPYNHRILMFGGGHAATARTDVDMLDLKRDKLQWQSLYPSMSCAQTSAQKLSPKGYHLTTGHPAARHTYDMTVIAPVNGIPNLMILSAAPGAGYCHRYYTTIRAVALLPLDNPSDNKWIYGRAFEFPWSDYAAAEYDPVSRRILIIGQNKHAGKGGMWVYNPNTDEVETFVRVDYEFYDHNLVYYPPTQTLYLFERTKEASQPSMVRKLILDRKHWQKSKTILLKTKGPAPVGGRAVGYAYDPQHRIIGGAVQNGYFHSFDPRNNTWTREKMKVASEEKDIQIGTGEFHTLDYDPINQVFIFIALDPSKNPRQKRTWAYKPDIR